ncbi:prolipoprotein diacylglyceryl transferase [Rothia sp. ZJ932]|uniref:prolipoprotein diacylglyceryl transferase n=1 Tax=Rothia sp. ZJ932 TaxID=2810516 RepID=UPI001966DB71|nr:prolipoprotein diacylglyceryl transferase [Rothia sp. ZJ932]QRZ60849.1 prolipoprotein diacylglyceryl transferase [Rothia sp. ZJ932]
MNEVIIASLPSPDVSQIRLGPLTIHFYALCILTGIIVCLLLTSRRWKSWGFNPDNVWDIAMWAIPFGIVGARMYHVLITDPTTYFGEGANPLDTFKIWEGGIGIMGAISVGALGAYLACRKYGVSFARFADAVAPGILIAQGIGRWGNWFNQELFGKPTSLPWGLEIDPNGYTFPDQYEPGTLFHPTFLYESIWNIVGALGIMWLAYKLRWKLGQTFWAYVAYYSFGRLMIEIFLRIDASQELFGLRIHVLTSGVLLLLGVIGFIIAGQRGRHRADSDALTSDRAATGSVSAR